MKRNARQQTAIFVSATRALFVGTLVAWAADEKPSDAIDWDRARQLRQRSQGGETLNALPVEGRQGRRRHN